MKKFMIVVLIIAVLLVAGGIAGAICSDNASGARTAYSGSNYYRGGMMGGYRDSYEADQGSVLGLDDLRARVEDYIAVYGDNLVISDIFVYEDADYYFSIMEKDTGLGAMELLVNPYTGDVYPEYGPNMMWNLKYGMHNNTGYGMMNRGRGMMGGSYRYQSETNFVGNTVSVESAKSLAADYLNGSTHSDYSVSNDVHEFYGYYTFHLEKAGETVGMLSVNGLTGEVWFHNWHGTLIDVIEGHDESEQ